MNMGAGFTMNKEKNDENSQVWKNELGTSKEWMIKKLAIIKERARNQQQHEGPS
jgi:hypothetical protein